MTSETLADKPCRQDERTNLLSGRKKAWHRSRFAHKVSSHQPVPRTCRNPLHERRDPTSDRFAHLAATRSYRTSIDRYLTSLLVTLLGLLLAACTTPQPGTPVTTPVEWEQHRLQITALQHWELRGKLGYRGPGANGSAWLTWQQDDDYFDLTLTGPMGAGATRISGNAQLAMLSRGRDEVRANSASALTREVLGVALPLEELLWWAKGLPAPGSQPTMRFDGGLLIALEQAGWHLQFSRYVDVEGLHLPGRITGTDNHNGLSFTLVINQWQPHIAGDPSAINE